MEEAFRKYYAHNKAGAPTSQWQLLDDHLQNAAEQAAEFAGSFSASEWGRLAGLWHDLGKYADDFQTMLLRSADDANRGHIDHSTPGAIYAEKQIKLGRILAYIIAGHHAGLPDWQSAGSGAAGLAYRLQKEHLLTRLPVNRIPSEIASPHIPEERPQPGSDPAFWIRMLFSCLVDADYMDTESFLAPEKHSLRTQYPSLSEFLPVFDDYMKEKVSLCDPTPVNVRRQEILERCLQMASHSPGIFTLTVPTGGGKTLSSMAFALHHAQLFQKKRIIYVIPYTSIIEQTADQFRDVFGEAVIEHHSNFDGTKNTTNNSEKRLLACENWDAPIIVTTSVQFFESFFSNRSSRCRKLHNIVNSVVILDEAQLLPPEFLNPILKALKELQRFYGVTIVFSTATQPALGPHKSPDFNFEGIAKMVEIIKNPRALYQALKRVEVRIPADLNRPRTWEEIAYDLGQYSSVLCVVNRRDDARQLFQLMAEGTIHLSALMCGAHRSAVIARIKDQLKRGLPTRVISTQLVEAGVDLDFPVVFRALAGLDSIAQAAGRCNREGKLKLGQVIVFVPPSQIPPGPLRQAAGIGRRLLGRHPLDPLTPENFVQYFQELYWLKGDGLDARRILPDLVSKELCQINFRSAAAKFQIIDGSKYQSVLVRYGEGSEFIELLRQVGLERWLMRKLQRYVVNLPKYVHSRLVAEGSIHEVYPGVFIQENSNSYDSVLGFCPDKSFVAEPDDLII